MVRGVGGVSNMCMCLARGGVGGLDQGLGGWGGVKSVFVVSLDSCVDGRSSYLYIVLSGYLRILGTPSVLSCCTLSISVS